MGGVTAQSWLMIRAQNYDPQTQQNIFSIYLGRNLYKSLTL